MALFDIYQKISYIILLILIKINLSDSNIYKIPIGIFNTLKDNDQDNLIKNIFFNYLYVNLSIGTPPQISPFHLDINSQTFYVSSKYFNRSASSTFEQISKNEITYSYEDAISGFNSKDVLNINNEKKKINFIFETKNKKDNDLGNIGLLIKNKFQPDVYSFSASLKEAKIINSFKWTLKFNDNIEIVDLIYNGKRQDSIGELIIGDDPHNYEKNKKIYDKTKYGQIKAIWWEKDLYWDIEFKSIYLTLKDNITESKNNKTSKLNIHGDRMAELNPDIGFLVGPSNFFHFITLNFFQKYSSICSQYRIEKTLFRIIECQNSNIFNISSFPDISFELEDMIFNLTYKDLFVLDKKINKYIFLVLYEGYIDHWILGRLFLRKYQLTFNEQNKAIGYYRTMNDYNREFIEKKNKIICIISTIIHMSFFIIPIIFVLFKIYSYKKSLHTKRKTKINELNDENDKSINLVNV